LAAGSAAPPNFHFRFSPIKQGKCEERCESVASDSPISPSQKWRKRVSLDPPLGGGYDTASKADPPPPSPLPPSLSFFLKGHSSNYATAVSRLPPSPTHLSFPPRKGKWWQRSRPACTPPPPLFLLPFSPGKRPTSSAPVVAAFILVYFPFFFLLLSSRMQW